MANGYGTPTGKTNIYIKVDGRWTYDGSPPIKNNDELASLVLQYQKQYGQANVIFSLDKLKESPQQASYTNRQSHANTRSAFKQITNVEADWAYRSKTMLKDSKWRR